MDIGALSMGMSNVALVSAVQISVLKMGMNTNEQTSNAMTEMMSKMAVEPGKGANIDKMV
jgi:hypothetical protein